MKGCNFILMLYYNMHYVADICIDTQRNFGSCLAEDGSSITVLKQTRHRSKGNHNSNLGKALLILSNIQLICSVRLLEHKRHSLDTIALLWNEVHNIMVKGEISLYEHLLFLPQCYYQWIIEK